MAGVSSSLSQTCSLPHTHETSAVCSRGDVVPHAVQFLFHCALYLLQGASQAFLLSPIFSNAPGYFAQGMSMLIFLFSAGFGWVTSSYLVCCAWVTFFMGDDVLRTQNSLFHIWQNDSRQAYLHFIHKVQCAKMIKNKTRIKKTGTIKWFTVCVIKCIHIHM